MIKNLALLLLPILIIPGVFLIFSFANLVVPISDSVISSVMYVLFPAAMFGMLALLALKNKMTLKKQTFSIFFATGLLYLFLTLSMIDRLFAPTLQVVELGQVGGVKVTVSTLNSTIQNFLILGLVYLSFVSSWFVSQFVREKFLKILFFVSVALSLSFVMSYVGLIVFVLFF